MNDTTRTVARSLHDLGLAAWFGGSLMGAVGINRAAASVAKDKQTTAVAGAGWAAWTPINLAAIGAHLLGGALLTAADRRRLVVERGAMSTSVGKLALTGVALGATGYSRLIGQQVIAAEGAPASDGTTPVAETPEEVARAQRQLAILQWVIPVSTGGLVVLGAVMGEQQRPARVASGVVDRVAALTHLLPTAA